MQTESTDRASAVLSCAEEHYTLLCLRLSISDDLVPQFIRLENDLGSPLMSWGRAREAITEVMLASVPAAASEPAIGLLLAPLLAPPRGSDTPHQPFDEGLRRPRWERHC